MYMVFSKTNNNLPGILHVLWVSGLFFLLVLFIFSSLQVFVTDWTAPVCVCVCVCVCVECMVCVCVCGGGGVCN